MVLVCLFVDQFQCLILMITVTKKEIEHSPSKESGDSVLLIEGDTYEWVDMEVLP